MIKLILVNRIIDMDNITLIIFWYNMDTLQNLEYLVKLICTKIQRIYYF